jgi:hypothetical protein
MLFLIRTAFWLVILVLLLPTDEQQRSEVYGTAEAAVRDVASFCDRNPETCATGRSAFDVLVQKAEFGANMLMGFIQDRAGLSGEESAWTGESAAMPLDSADWETSSSQDTLNPEDREVAWDGPADAGS